MTKDVVVRCTITFTYGPDSYLFGEDELRLLSDEVVFDRCRRNMMDDLLDVDPSYIHAEFVEEVE